MSGVNEYTYNAEDVRIRNICGSDETIYTYNTNCKLSQLLMKTTNGVVTKYLYGLGLIGEEKQGDFKTYHFDYRGSTVAITNESGVITDTFEYDTYGKLIFRTGSTFVIFGYNGRDGVITDRNGLIYMRARYYILGPSSKFAKGLNVVPFVSVIVDTGTGIYENYQNGVDEQRIMSDSVVDLGFSVTGTILSMAAAGFTTGFLAGSVAPGVGNLIGALVGLGTSIGFYFVTEVSEYKDKSMVEWAKERLDWVYDKLF